MKTLTEANLTYEDAKKYIESHTCGDCDSGLSLAWGGLFGVEEYVIRCSNDREHNDFVKPQSEYKKRGIEALTWARQEEIMVENIGVNKSRVLAKYVGHTTMTKPMITDIVETLWGDAPVVEKNKCILLCLTYQLNPLMKHIYLVGYKRWKAGKQVTDGRGNPIIDWSIQIGIGATRLLAQRKHNYSYLDMTPRLATPEEIKKILGDTADAATIYGFVHLKDQDSGAEAYGLRGCKKDENIKGTEKGNTHLNMACVRAERQALDRQYPGEMPAEVEIFDERYIDADYKVLDEDTGKKVQVKTGEIIEGKAADVSTQDQDPEPEPETEANRYAFLLRQCPEHGDAWNINRFKQRCHPMPDKAWCNFNNQLKLILAEVSRKVFDSKDALKAWIVENYGKTQSKLTEEEWVEMIGKIDGMANAESAVAETQAPLAPVASDADPEPSEEESAGINPDDIPF